MPRNPRNLWEALSQGLGKTADMYPQFMQMKQRQQQQGIENEDANKRFKANEDWRGWQRDQADLNRAEGAQTRGMNTLMQQALYAIDQQQAARGRVFDEKKLDRMYPEGWRNESASKSKPPSLSDALKRKMGEASEYSVRQGGYGFSTLPKFQEAAYDAATPQYDSTYVNNFWPWQEDDHWKVDTIPGDSTLYQTLQNYKQIAGGQGQQPMANFSNGGQQPQGDPRIQALDEDFRAGRIDEQTYMAWKQHYMGGGQ